MDVIANELDTFTRQTGMKTLKYQNEIAEEQRNLQDIEAEKTQIILGNEVKNEEKLKATKEDGIILMSIKSIW